MPEVLCLKRPAKLFIKGLRKEGPKIKDIPPYQIKSPVRLNLLDSKGHIPPFRKVLKKDVVANTITEAFDKAVDKFPWTDFKLDKVDGFSFP